MVCGALLSVSTNCRCALFLCVLQFGRKTLHRLRRNILRHMLAGSAGIGQASPPDSGSDSDTFDADSLSPESEDDTAGEPVGWYSNSCSSSDDELQGENSPGRASRFQQQQQKQAAEDAARAFQGVGMVYGALPPESRRTQAALFNARGDVWPRTSVLVASDAVGMGLNLNIRRWASRASVNELVVHMLYDAHNAHVCRLRVSCLLKSQLQHRRHLPGH
jgi:hypothetical protein